MGKTMNNSENNLFLLLLGVLLGFFLITAVIFSVPHKDNMKLFWMETTIGGAPFVECFNPYYEENGYFNCDSNSAGRFDYVGVRFNLKTENDVNQLAIAYCKAFIEQNG
jgi:hypothetical protein